MKCPFELPVRVIETNGSIVDANNEMVVKVLYSHKNFELQIKQLHYTAKAINSHEKLKTALEEIEAVSCGEKQVAEDDSEGMGWIYKRIQALKEAEK